MNRSSWLLIGATLMAMVSLGGLGGCATDDLAADSERDNQGETMGPVAPAPSVPLAGRSEIDLVNELVTHRDNYLQHLRALITFYTENGYEQKARWARAELTSMQKVRRYNYLTDNQVAVTPPSAATTGDIRILVAGVYEPDLVESLVMHRQAYAGLLQALVTFYSENGLDAKANQAREELYDVRRVKQYAYLMDAELPLPTLRPTESIAEADQLYDEAMKLLDEGGHGLLFVFNRRTMNLTMAKLKDLIAKYPTSDKIDDAAYYIAEIYKEYGEERDNQLAIAWYKRAIDLNPKLPHPAWSHAAHVLDFRMHERERALEWYHKVLENEAGMDKVDSRFAMNVEVAHQRIRQLSEELPEAASEPMPEVQPAPEPTAPASEAPPVP